MKKIFYESLKKYKKLNRSSFHTPGHKCVAFKSNRLLDLDLTELPATDSLFEAGSIIKASEEHLQKLYGTKMSLFSAGGNTLCIQTMLRLAAPQGGKILCARTIHRSAISAMALLGIEPIWIPEKIGKKSGLPEGIDIEYLKKCLENGVDYKALYLTSPNYYGVLQDIASISQECKKFDVPVLVDNAHGSHLMFTPKNLHPLNLGASMTADSAHKTLPVLTGGAWLHINDERFVRSAKSAMALFGSTSPSYPVMASMDICVSWLFHAGKKEFKKLCEKTDVVKKLAADKGFFVVHSELTDPARITLGVWKLGLTGYEFREYLYRFKIEPEFCDKNYVVLISTPFNTKEDWYRLKKAISFAPKKAFVTEDVFQEDFLHLPKIKMTPREALMLPAVSIDVEYAKGRIAAETVCRCPPGVPALMPGEEIGNFEYKALKNYGISQILVLK